MLTRLSLKNRAFVALLSVIITVLGVFSVLTMRQELIPSVELPQVSVVTVSPGATSEQMKARVSVPIEQQVALIPEVESTTTRSSSGLSMVQVSLAYGTDLARATSKVELAANRANTNFPEGAETNVVSGGTSSIPLAFVAVTSDGSPLEVANRIRSTVVPGLEKVSGISQVMLIGAPEQNVLLSLDGAKIARAGVDQNTIRDVLTNSGLAVPVGSVLNGDNTLDVTVGKAMSSLDELKNLPIPSDAGGKVTKLADFATVELQMAEETSLGNINGKPAQAIIIYPTASANIVATTQAFNNKLGELEKTIGANTKFTTMFEQAPYITGSVESLAREGILGLLFAVLVILLFLTSLRSTLVTAISIPLSLLIGFIGMLISGYTVNMLTLAALTLTIGRVVDDSIVVIENIKRHLEYGKPKREAIVDAVKEVSRAVIASTIVSFIVFVPIGLVSGMVGELFRPFAFTVVIALAASLFVALTIVPVLAYWFLRPSVASRLAAREGTSEAHRREVEAAEENYWLRRAYRPAFEVTQRHPGWTLAAALAILFATVAMFPLLKINLMGTSNSGVVMLSQKVVPGMNLDALEKAAAPVEAALQKVNGVSSVAAFGGGNGRGSGGGFSMGVGGSTSGPAISYMVSIDRNLDLSKITKTLVGTAEDALGVKSGDGTITDLSSTMLGSSSIDIQFTAPNEDAAIQTNDALLKALADLKNVKSIESDLTAATPAIQITVDKDRAAAAGVSENDVVGMISAQLVNPEIGTITLNNIDTSIKVAATNPVKTLEELRAMTLLGRPIDTFATIEEVKLQPTITTIDGQTTTTISVKPEANGNLGAVANDVSRAIDRTELPDGVSVTEAGASQDLTESFNQLLLALMAAVLLIYLVLVWIFKSLLQPALLLVAIPFAAIGSFVALLVTGTALDLSAMVGLLMLTGIVVTNAVVLIDLINQYHERGDDIPSAIRDGAMRRLRPIVMTALATVAAMVPMALGFGSTSSFISKPLAVTVIGGLVSSTLLTLVLLPVLYRLVVGWLEKHKSARARRENATLDAAAGERGNRGLVGEELLKAQKPAILDSDDDSDFTTVETRE